MTSDVNCCRILLLMFLLLQLNGSVLHTYNNAANECEQKSVVVRMDGRIVGRSMFVVHAWCWANVAEEGAAYIGSSNRSCCSSKSCLVLCEFLRFTIQLKFCEWSELFKLYIYYMYINCSTISIDVYLHITYFIYVCIWIGLHYLRFAAQLLLVDLESTWT